MISLWASLTLVFGSWGLATETRAELIVAAFCGLMAAVSAVWRDYRINKNASPSLALQLRVGMAQLYADETSRPDSGAGNPSLPTGSGSGREDTVTVVYGGRRLPR